MSAVEKVIETARLVLRPWREEDAPAMFRYACDPEIGLPADWSPHPSVEYSREIIRTVFAAPETYAVVLKSTGEPAGSCGLMFSADNAGEAEIGYWIGRPWWGRGFIPEAAEALLARGFTTLGLTAVWCCHAAGNDKSKRVCQKCGFRFHHAEYGVASPLGGTRDYYYWLMTRADYLRHAGAMNSL